LMIDVSRSISAFAAAFVCVTRRAKDDETKTCREFTLEGQGRGIRWLCPF
jgi:hypothetical protein